MDRRTFIEGVGIGVTAAAVSVPLVRAENALIDAIVASVRAPIKVEASFTIAWSVLADATVVRPPQLPETIAI